MNYRMICTVLFFGAVCFTAHGQSGWDIRHLQWSPQGDKALVSDFAGSRFLIYDLASSQCLAVAETLTGGMMAVWSPDGKRVGFKIVRDVPGGRGQAAAVYEVESQRVIQLCPLVALAGNPSFGPGGKIAFTIGNRLQILDAYFNPVGAVDLPCYSNYVAFSPDGNAILYSDEEDGICRLDLVTGSHSQIPAHGFCPQWSPDGSKILIRTLLGEAQVVDVESSTSFTLGPADTPFWTDDGRIIASRKKIAAEELRGGEIVEYELSGECRSIIGRAEAIFSPTSSPDGNSLLFQCESDFCLMDLRRRDVRTLVFPEPTQVVPVPELAFDGGRANKVNIIRGVPYHHQIYCTRFTKAVSCGASSATMILAYYGRLSHWDFTASAPFRHTSHYGNYVSEIYTWGNYKFDKWGSGSSAPTYGAHGYIWQTPVDTKAHLKEYFQCHDVVSAVDWSPTWDKVKDKVTARRPFVILSSITSSGHYQTVVGYWEGQRTVVVNDPYGNKNEGYGKYNGACVNYDWPGYNNGYANLNQVHCFIYADATPPAVKPGTVDDPIMIPAFPYTDANTTRTSNGTDLFDRYSCSPANEKGREMTYLFTISRPGTLTVSVTCDGASDIDIHLLSQPSAAHCIVRGHTDFTRRIEAGTYYLICDTFVDGNGTEMMGDYTLRCTFAPDSSR